MKKVLLSLAAVAALASCVKENISEPVQNAGKYTIKAAAQISKTTLAGTTVEWEVTDEIAVVLDGDNPVMAKFAAVEATLNGSKADFTGDFNLDGDLKFSDYNCAYAVNPSSAVDFINKKISHTLAADQTEGVKSGDLLSSALVSLEALPKGEAQAQFQNALTLLQVAVPAGVQKVEFTADMYSSLVGTAEFTVDAETGKLAVSKPSTSRKVTLEAAAGLEAKTYPVLVYPGKVKELTLHMVGLDGAEYTNTVKDLEFVAGEYRTINLCNIFGIYSEDTLYATPAGGNVLVPVVSAVDHEFTVTTDASWITYVETKGFHGTEIVLNVEANTTGAAREASVTVKWGEDAKDSRTYKVSQEALYDHFLNVEWEESFGLYSSESDAKNETNAKVTYKNVFTIELSDDFSKGMYKVNGMLVENNSYNGKAGATYYANYNDGQLIVLKNDKGYAFNDKEVVFTYNEAEKTFTAAPIKFGYKFDNADMRNGGYIGGYKAVVKVEEPTPDTPSTGFTLEGAWDQVVTGMSWPSPSATMTIAVSGSTVTITDFIAAGTVAEGTLNGNIITIPAGTMVDQAGPLDADVVLTVSDDYNTITAGAFTVGGWINVSAYSAEKQEKNVATEPETPEVPEVPEVGGPTLDGAWNQNVAGMSWPSPSATMTIAVSGSTVTITDFVVAGTVAEGTLSGNQITVPAGTAIGTGSNQAGPLDADVVLTISADYNTITAEPFSIASWCNVSAYSAEKQEKNAGTVTPEPEPEAPAIDFAGLDWASAAVAVNGESATSDSKMKEISAFGDDEYLYVRLTTAQGLPLGADHLGLSFCDGEGSNEVWWGWTTTGTNTYYGEHMGEIDADGKLTGMSFGDAEVICHTEVSGESVTWYLAFPRESVEQYVSAKGKIYVSALLWNAWSEYWAAPARGGSMLQVTLFEDPNSLKNADWNAADVVSYDLPSGASSSRQSLRSVKYFTDADNVKVRIVASAAKLAEQVDGVPTTHLGIFLYDVVNGSGDGYYEWWGNAAGNNEYEGEHVGVITGTDLSLSVNGVAVEVEKVVEGDDVVWMFAIPRSAHANLAANEVNMAFIAYRNWGQTGALPDKYGEMFKVTFP